MRIITFLAAVGLTAVMIMPAAAQASKDRPMPADFKSDGCSLFPDGNYRECCVAHDQDYYFGGSSAERRASDKRLYKCVKARRNKFTARLMWFGVRIGGVSFLPTPFRWGFGNKFPRSRPKPGEEKSVEKPTVH